MSKKRQNKRALYRLSKTERYSKKHKNIEKKYTSYEEREYDNVKLSNDYRKKIFSKTLPQINSEENLIGQFNNYSYAITILKPEKELTDREIYGTGTTFSSFYQSDPNRAMTFAFDKLEKFLNALFESSEDTFARTKIDTIKLSRLRALGDINRSAIKVEKNKNTQIEERELEIGRDEQKYFKYLKRRIIDDHT